MAKGGWWRTGGARSGTRTLEWHHDNQLSAIALCRPEARAWVAQELNAIQVKKQQWAAVLASGPSAYALSALWTHQQATAVQMLQRAQLNQQPAPRPPPAGRTEAQAAPAAAHMPGHLHPFAAPMAPPAITATPQPQPQAATVFPTLAALRGKYLDVVARMAGVMVSEQRMDEPILPELLRYLDSVGLDAPSPLTAKVWAMEGVAGAVQLQHQRQQRLQQRMDAAGAPCPPLHGGAPHAQAQQEGPGPPQPAAQNRAAFGAPGGGAVHTGATPHGGPFGAGAQQGGPGPPQPAAQHQAAFGAPGGGAVQPNVVRVTKRGLRLDTFPLEHKLKTVAGKFLPLHTLVDCLGVHAWQMGSRHVPPPPPACGWWLCQMCRREGCRGGRQVCVRGGAGGRGGGAEGRGCTRTCDAALS